MTQGKTVQTVVLFLGLVALVALAGTLSLIGYAMHLAGSGDLSSAAGTLLAIPASLAATAIGALGALLVSTRSGPAEPVPVTATEPLPVDPVQPLEVPDTGLT